MAVKRRAAPGRPSPWVYPQLRVDGETWGERPGEGPIEIANTGQSSLQAQQEAAREIRRRRLERSQAADAMPAQLEAVSAERDQLRQQLAESIASNARTVAVVAQLQARLESLEARVVEPDIERRLEVSESVATNLDRALQMSTAVGQAQDRVMEVAATAEEQAALAEQERTTALAVARGLQEVQNGVLATVTQQVNGWAERFNDQEQRFLALAARLADSWELIERAEKIEDSTRAMVRALMGDWFAEFREQQRMENSINAGAMGLRQSDLDRYQRQLADGLQPDLPVISPLMLRVFQEYERRRLEAEERTNRASAESAGRLNW